MPIRGIYHSQLRTIGLDLTSHLFEDDGPVVHHELSHYYLSLYTNIGAVHAILSEISLPPFKTVVDIKRIREAMAILHDDMYTPQEGLAHLMQAIDLFKKGGLPAVKEWEDRLPDNAKQALSTCRFVVKLEDEYSSLFTEKISECAMNNSLHTTVVSDSALLLDANRLKEFLAVPGNSTKERFEKCCRAVERDVEILKLGEDEICAKAGIPYFTLISNKERAGLVNTIRAFTTEPTALTENDIRTVKTTSEIFGPALESMIVSDVNTPVVAIAGVPRSEIFAEIPRYRTIFIYNNPESPQQPGHFGFYSFSRKRRIINSSLLADGGVVDFLKQQNLTKVLDTHSYDYVSNAIRPERSFLTPNIIWYKSFEDFSVFTEMAERLSLETEVHTLALTAGHKYRFLILRIKGQGFFHILPTFPAFIDRIREGKFTMVVPDFFEFISGNEIHLNNFFHDILGAPVIFDLLEMTRNPEEHLKKAKLFQENRAPRNAKCICGSDRKHKWCHGWV